MNERTDNSPKRYLIKHVGNMGDMVFFIPPVLETIKKLNPDNHITFVTAWGYKDKAGRWGKRNQDGFSISLMLTNPNIDQLVHWHDTKLDLSGNICEEEDRKIPTWSKKYFDEMKSSSEYDEVHELDFGIKMDDDPIKRMYDALNIPDQHYSNYQLYLTDEDLRIAKEVTKHLPHPRIILLEGIAGQTTRGWDPLKVKALRSAIKKKYKVEPVDFGSRNIPYYQGKPLTLRQNIATLTFADIAIGVLSGPMHFAGSVGLPTLTLYCDQPIHRAALSFFLNPYIKDNSKKHRTLLGPSLKPYKFLKSDSVADNLTPEEASKQKFKSWLEPGKQSSKSCLSVITVDEVMRVVQDMLNDK